MTAPAADDESLVGRLAGEMVDRWRRGDRPPAEEFLDRTPSLRLDPNAALELIAEELALRGEFGIAVTADELARRFPAWQPQVRALVECHRVLGPGAAPRFPAPGERLGEFDLGAEIGRGAHGRVFLATQPALGGRPVVIKLGPPTGQEHLALARLQHTNIVPLYSAHEYPDCGLRVLCMPDFGGATLADALRPAAAAVVGAGLLRRPGGAAPAPIPPRTPGAGLMAPGGHLNAVCRVGLCLADALRYAHDRGLLHLDLKPSNVLIAADGTPMLLDFHLARPPLPAGAPAPGWLGGTRGYMAPEHAAAIEAVRHGAVVPAAVGPGADVYSLGVVLAEAIRALPTGVGGVPPLGLTDILGRCVAAAPADRYPTAAELAADLGRHLADLPLRGVPNRSRAERWRKWRRRRPGVFPGGLVAAALLAVWAGVAVHFARQSGRAEAAAGDARAHLDNGRYAAASGGARDGLAIATGLPFGGGVTTRLRATWREAGRGLAADELHAVCQAVRPLYTAEVVTPAQLAAANHRCREVWDRRDAVARTLGDGPNPVPESRWRADLLDLGILTAHFHYCVAAASSADRGAAARAALACLDQAETLYGTSLVLELERTRYARVVGLREVAAEAARRAESAPPRGAWEATVVGRAALAADDLARAGSATDLAVELDPGGFWPNYYKGICRLRLGHPAEALASFSACVALAPESAWCYCNRGMAFAALDRPDPARADFDRALSLDPNLAAALVGRAAVLHRGGRHTSALADLGRAADLGAPAAEVEYRKAVVSLARDDRAAAVACLRACLAADPGHGQARELLARLAADP